MKLKALIVDDEASAREVMEILLLEHTTNVEIVDKVDDVPNAIKAINKYNPDIVFLDIEMPGYSGFQLLDFFEEFNFQIIFTTAYHQYALKAFQVSATDYLVKPIQAELLVNAVEKCKKYVKKPSENLKILKQNIHSNSFQRIALPVSNGFLFQEIKDIIYLEAEGSYTNFILQNGSTILVSKKIKEFENILNIQNNFYRPHRSYIINLQKVKQFIRTDGGSIFMENDFEIPVSRELKEELLSIITNAT